eukprot:XP_006593114.1 transcription factor SRM1-like [Glycine max]
MWNNSVFEVDRRVKGRNFLILVGRWTNDNLRLFIVNVYAPCDLAGKRAMWEELRQLRASNPEVFSFFLLCLFITVDEVGSSSEWSTEQDKAFENALAIHPEDASDRWEKIVADIPGKTLEEIKHHYELLVEDVNQIESGCVPLPSYNSSPEGSTSHASDEGAGKKGGHSWNSNNESNHGTKASRSDKERRKGIAWTEDEHRLVYLCFNI